MNNKVDDVLYKLVETKKFIAKAALNDNSNTSYENTIKGLNNIIVDYTMNNKMSRKEILDITFSLYDIEVEKTFLDKVKDFLNIPKHIKNTKEKIIENHKKKETKKQYEKETNHHHLLCGCGNTRRGIRLASLLQCHEDCLCQFPDHQPGKYFEGERQFICQTKGGLYRSPGRTDGL